MLRRHKIMLLVGCTLLLVGALLGPLPARAQAPAVVDEAAIDAFLRAQLAAHRLPGLAVAVAQGDRVVMTRGYGAAGRGRPVTPQTPFYLGSLTKSFTALAAMQLVEAGQLELEAPVQRYLPWFRVADEAASAQITVRHLLNQTTGLSPAADPGVARYQPTLEAQVRAMRSARLTAPVGSRFQYDNQNYRVLGLLIETVSGQTYADYLGEHVLAPLAMTHSAADPADAPDLAQGHGQMFGLAVPRRQPFRPGALPSGYVMASAEDLGHYLVALLNEGRYGATQVVRPETLALMQTPPPGIGSTYGMGWMRTASTDAEPLIYHTGALENFYAVILILPQRNMAYALLLNQNSLFQTVTGQQALIEGLANVLIGDPVPPRKSLGWFPLALAGAMAVDLAIHALRLAGLGRWRARMERRRPWRRWFNVGFDLVVPPVVFVGLPLVISRVMGDAGSWREAWGLLPDLTLWLWLGLALTLVRGALKARALR